MTTTKDILRVLAIFVLYGIAGNMDYADEIEGERRRVQAQSVWRDCVANAAMRDVAEEAHLHQYSLDEEHCRMAFLHRE
ncbi:MAG: hypothetical protein LBR95_01565 [Azoarcus sp.]|jgi:hypothetical protein|nr:hypothetical protein [Azoarcus sp.]